MPLDPNIPLSIQPAKFNSPFETLAQVYALRGAQQEQQLRQQQMQANQALEQERQQQIAKQKKQEQDQETLNALIQANPDRAKLREAIRSQAPEYLDKFDTSMSKLDETAATATKNLADARLANASAGEKVQSYFAGLGAEIDAHGNTAVALKAAGDHAIATFPDSPEVKQRVEQAYQQVLNGTPIETISKGLMALTQKQFNAAPGDTQFNAAGKPIAALAPKPEAPSTAALDAQAQALMTRKNLGAKLSPEEEASLQAYNQRKTVVADASAVNAANRQAETQGQQNTIQQNAQKFQMQQAGRKELSEKIEQPYQTALASAQTMRDTVAAAQGGNKVGAALQSLETTMAAIRAQGLNRINTAEIGVTGNAGSMWDRIQGWLGKATEGQPVPANVQKDMTDFAGILEKSARNKYEQGFASTTKRYGLDDEKMLPFSATPSSAAAPAPATATAGPKVGEIRIINGQRGQWDGKVWRKVG